MREKDIGKETLLKEIEAHISEKFIGNKAWLFSIEVTILKNIEAKKVSLLRDKEMDWIMKSRATLLAMRD